MCNSMENLPAPANLAIPPLTSGTTRRSLSADAFGRPVLEAKDGPELTTGRGDRESWVILT